MVFLTFHIASFRHAFITHSPSSWARGSVRYRCFEVFFPFCGLQWPAKVFWDRSSYMLPSSGRNGCSFRSLTFVHSSTGPAINLSTTDPLFGGASRHPMSKLQENSQTVAWLQIILRTLDKQFREQGWVSNRPLSVGGIKFLSIYCFCCNGACSRNQPLPCWFHGWLWVWWPHPI